MLIKSRDPPTGGSKTIISLQDSYRFTFTNRVYDD